MRHDARLVCVVALVAGCSSKPARRGPDLQITTESTKLRRGEELPDASPIFDGETISLRAARWETLAFIVWRRDPTPVPISIELDPGCRTALYAVEELPVSRASTSMYGTSRGAGHYPDKLVPTTTAGRATLVEIDPSSGCDGALVVGGDELEVTLRITDVELADAPARVWAYYDPDEAARASVPEAELAETFARYGVIATPDLVPETWERYRAQLGDLPYIPVYLPRDPAAIAEMVPAWIDRARGTGKVPFAIPIDEPGDDAARARVRELAEAARERDGAPGQFLYAVTDEPREIYGDAVDVFLTPVGLMRERPASPERWTYNGGPPSAGSMILDTDGVAMRTWGWIGWRWRIPLWYVWDALYWTDRHNSERVADFTKDATTFHDGEDHGALDGVLVYPDGAPSLRLAALRRGLQDRRLLEAVEACAGRPTADAIARDLVPTALGDAGKPGGGRAGSWPLDEAKWEAARLALLDRLVACER